MEEKRTYRTHTAAEVVAMWSIGIFSLWEGNRRISEKRAARIAAEVTKVGDFGPIPIVIGRVGGASYVIDGQHRLQAAKLLNQIAANRATLCVCWETCRDETELIALFRNVNCGSPVPPSHWNPDVKQFSQELASAIRRNWSSDVFSENASSQRPRITEATLFSVIDNCRETREAASIHCLSVPNALAILIQMNAAAEQLLGGGGKAIAMKNCEVSHKMLGIATRLKFFVGLQKGWLEFFVAHLSGEWRAAGAGD